MVRPVLVLAVLVVLCGAALADPMRYTPGEDSLYEVVRMSLNPRLQPYAEEEPMLSEEEDVWKKPKFCRKYDCPLFKVINKTRHYELREYAPIRWVSAQTKGLYYRSMVRNFMRLFKYIEGNNKEGKKFNMTVPVVNLIQPRGESDCKRDFTLSFFLTQNMRAAFPEPNDKNITFHKTPKLRAYVRSFRGYAKYFDVIHEAKFLARAINDTSKYETRYYYTASYNGPWTIFRRHNEVIFLAK